jgi:starch synthase
VDYGAWDPARDKLIAARYSAKDLSGKQVCKKDLLETMGLPKEHLGRPVIGIVSRFVDQKGFNLIAEKAHELMREDLALTVVGTGERKYEDFFRALAAAYPSRVGLKIAYDNGLAHKVEAGADMFLMPSRYEPCGMNQLYSMKYGTIPIVRATGGLKDSVSEFDPVTSRGTGFLFEAYHGADLLAAIDRALTAFRCQKNWAALMQNAMHADYSWEHSAREYESVYRGGAD